MRVVSSTDMERTIYTSCTLDCPDGCGIIAHVKDGRVVKLEGHPDHEFNSGGGTTSSAA